MNTPTNGNTHITRSSSRKKSLFSSRNENYFADVEKNNDNDFKNKSFELNGIEPFDTNTNMNKTLQIMLNNNPPKKVISFLDNPELSNSNLPKMSYPQTKNGAISKIIDSPSPNSLSVRSSSRIKVLELKKSNSPIQTSINFSKSPKHGTPKTPKNSNNSEELSKLFSSTLSIRIKKLHNNKLENEIIIEETPLKSVKKRQIGAIKSNESEQRERKILKIDNIKISPKSFYSNKSEHTTNKIPLPSNYSFPSLLDLVNVKNNSPKSVQRKQRKRAEPEPVLFKNKRRNNVLFKKYQNQRKKLSIDEFLKTIKNEKLKCLPSKRLLPEQIEEVRKILKSNENEIKTAKPLNLESNKNESDFSDLESSDEENIVNITKTEKLKSDDFKETNTHLEKSTKKFFKSGISRVKKQIQITKQIKATLSHGKLTLDLYQKKKQKCHKTKTNELFAKEQEHINHIIDGLVNCESIPDTTVKVIGNPPILDNELNEIPKTLQTNEKSYSTFYSKIPYNTNDVKIIEQQTVLVDFLVANNICNEENFEIFIANPEDHKDKAARIIQNLEEEMMKSNDWSEYRNRIPYNTDNPEKIELQHLLLDFLIENQICTEENFNIFIANPDKYKEEAEKIVNSLVVVSIDNDNTQFSSNDSETQSTIEYMIDDSAEQIVNNEIPLEQDMSNANESVNNESNQYFPIFYPRKCNPLHTKLTRPRTFKKNLTKSAKGSNQYQIDAGQKEFGAKQCSQCGLIYTVHEPEEEKIHAEYHQSLHVLKFRGWIDEDIVLKNELWSSDGRVIRITSFSHIRKKQRLIEILQNVVDKELGFSSYILPEEYVAFLAVKRQQIVGVCLVQFLESANRYVYENSVDCCTEELFPAKCGVSRIWVSPFHRKLGIASTLISCIQQYTIKGENIDMALIAFSAPTEDGKAFAKKISKRDDFLVYQ